MNLKELSLEQLKALAYDEIKKLEVIKQNLQILNLEIDTRSKNSQKEIKE